VVAFECEGEVVAAGEGVVFVLQTELADGWVVARLFSEELAPVLVLRLVGFPQSGVEGLLLGDCVEQGGDCEGDDCLEAVDWVSPLGWALQLCGRLGEPPAETLEQTPVFEDTHGQRHLRGVLALQGLLEHHADDLARDARILLVLAWVGLEGL